MTLAATLVPSLVGRAAEPCDGRRTPESLPLPADATTSFGTALSAGADFIAIGNSKSPPIDATRGAGSVVVYRRDGAGWELDAVILAPPNTRGISRFFEFGQSVAVSGDCLAATSRERAWLFRRQPGEGASWKLIHEMAFDDVPTISVAAAPGRVAVSHSTRTVVLEQTAGEPETWTVALDWPEGAFGLPGRGLALAGDLLVYARSYRATVLRRSSAGWELDGQFQTLTDYRTELATDGHRVAASYSASYQQPFSGTVDVYGKSGSGIWQREAHIAPPNNADDPESAFGFALALSGDRLAIGSHLDDFAGTDCGAVYCYRYSQGVWRPVESHAGQADALDGQFGYRVAISADDLVVTGSGYWALPNPTVYPFCAESGSPRACTPGIVGLLNFVELFLAGDLAADYTADGALSPEDLFRFLADWFAGCPG